MKHVAAVTLALVIALLAAPKVGGAPAPEVVRSPRNFVYALSCPAPFGPTTAGFAIPGARDLPALNAAGAEQIWIDLSLQNNNFARGTFIGAGPFVPGRSGVTPFLWDNLEYGRHYYRLNALRDGQWIELGRGSFETLNCGVVQGMECWIGHPDGVLGVGFGIAPVGQFRSTPAREQWLDLTLFASRVNPMLDNGFLPGTFVGAGPFPASGAQHWWTNIRPALRHFYRVNAFYPGPNGGWVQQYSGSFLSLDCRNLPAFDAPG